MLWFLLEDINEVEPLPQSPTQETVLLIIFNESQTLY